MRPSTRPQKFTPTGRAGAVYAAAFAAPGAVIAATGDLSGAALPVSLLLGLFLVALVGYLASARALVERPTRAKAVPRASATAAPGAC